jgi:hypothetical protein
MKIILAIIMWVAAFLLHVWSMLALFFCSFPSHPEFRLPLVILYGLAVFSWIVFSRRKLRAMALSLLVFLAIAVWFSSIKPPKNATYPPELALSTVDFNGGLVTIHGVRNCDYRAKDDFDVRYETRDYDFRNLKTLDVMVNYWGMSAIAHTFLSFGFSDGKYLAVSIEIRPAVGKVYGMINGLFKQYELIYIWGDERDLVRFRTNYKGESVYLYRTSWTPETIRRLFVTMLQRTQTLSAAPQFYNTATQSCTNTIGNDIIASHIARIPWYKRKLLTGDVDRRLYDAGILMTQGKPFEELRKESLIDWRAKAADQDTAFSKKIRTHLEKK